MITITAQEVQGGITQQTKIQWQVACPRMVIYEIQSDIKAIEQNSALYEETNFGSRVEAIEYIEFNIIDRIEGLFHSARTGGYAIG